MFMKQYEEIFIRESNYINSLSESEIMLIIDEEKKKYNPDNISSRIRLICSLVKNNLLDDACYYIFDGINLENLKSKVYFAKGYRKDILGNWVEFDNDNNGGGGGNDNCPCCDACEDACSGDWEGFACNMLISLLGIAAVGVPLFGIWYGCTHIDSICEWCLWDCLYDSCC